MATRPITKGFEDKSDEQGYRFVFKCDMCGTDFMSKYVEAESNKRRNYISMATRAISLGKSILDTVPVKDKPTLDDADKKQTELAAELSKRYEGMSPKWHTDHDAAFQQAQAEVMKEFRYCQACKRWVCQRDWDDAKMVCINDSQQRICPKCSKIVGSAKFCTFCGSALQMTCPKCGKEYGSGVKFCGECGTSLG